MTDVATGVPMADDTAEPVEIGSYDSDEAIAARHYLLRHTDRLRYHPPESACVALCSYHDNLVDGRFDEHQCYLIPNHADLCEFSSECIRQHLQEVPSGIIEAAVAS